VLTFADTGVNVGAPLTPLFSTFYMQHPAAREEGGAPVQPSGSGSELSQGEEVRPQPPNKDGTEGVAPPHLRPAALPPLLPLPDAGDAAAVHAERVFWEAVRILRPSDAGTDGEGEGEESAITSLWPPMESRDDDEEDG
jgi:hypothetical protein